MAVSRIKAVFAANVQEVWNIVTSLENYQWRSDLSRIEVLNEKQFVEYTKTGFPTTFTITASEDHKRWEFDMENSNMSGHWTGIFTEKDGQTEIDFTENAVPKKFIMKPFVKAFLKKQQKQYAADLAKALQGRRDKNDNVKINAEKNCATAIKYAKSFDKKFDYSRDSIKDLEEILDYYSNDISKSRPTENQIWSMAVIFGSYLGEVMLKNGLAKKGYVWEKDDTSDIPLLSAGGSYVTPNDKVYKRLVNGKEDDVVSFYDAVMGMRSAMAFPLI